MQRIFSAVERLERRKLTGHGWIIHGIFHGIVKSIGDPRATMGLQIVLILVLSDDLNDLGARYFRKHPNQELGVRSVPDFLGGLEALDMITEGGQGRNSQ